MITPHQTSSVSAQGTMGVAGGFARPLSAPGASPGGSASPCELEPRQISQAGTKSPFQGDVPPAASARRRQILSEHLLLIPTMSALIPRDPSRSRSGASAGVRHQHARLRAGKSRDCRERTPGTLRHPTAPEGTSTPGNFARGFPSREQNWPEKTLGMRSRARISLRSARRSRFSSCISLAMAKRALKLHRNALQTPYALCNSKATRRKFLDPPRFPAPGAGIPSASLVPTARDNPPSQSSAVKKTSRHKPAWKSSSGRRR